MNIKLDMPIALNEALRVMEADYTADSSAFIKGISTDSRELADGYLFFALGKGEDYVDEAMKSSFAVSARNKSAISVPSVTDALLKLGSYYKATLPSLKNTIAVTGSVGKSCVKDYTAALLGEKFKVHKTKGNYNNEIGMPISVFSSPCDTEVLVLELGMNRKGEIKKLSCAVNPNIAIITNIGTAHIGNLGSRKDIAEAKLEILSGMKDGICIIPSDESLLKDITAPPELIRVGKDGDFNLCDFAEDDEKMSFTISTPHGKTAPVYLPWQGRHFALNLAFATAAAMSAGVEIESINKVFCDYSKFIPRQKYINIGKLNIYNDTYNASYESYLANFNMIKARPGYKSAVIGDILELGERTEKIHSLIGKLCAEFKLDRIYPFGNYAEYVRAGALAAGFPSDRIFANEDILDPMYTAQLICDNSMPGETILIKGSHAVGTDRIITCIKEISELK